MVKSPETLLNIPVHVAVIPDGNRRWAKEKGLPSLVGHKKGVEKFDELYNRAREMGIKCITTWIFSTENWKRSEEEKEYLFDLARDLLKKYKQKFIKEKVRFVHLGRKDRIPEDIARALIRNRRRNQRIYGFYLGFGYGLRRTRRVNKSRRKFGKRRSSKLPRKTSRVGWTPKAYLPPI
jgi:undecaprenyl diphosphate synthase